jgi:signal transduction histidine kinase/CheY-like chemotaxis protein
MEFSKKLLPIVAGGLLVAYVLLLLGLSQYEQNARRSADEEQIRLNLEKRAAALSYFYSVRRDDLAALGAHQSVTSFFANRDLGMSLRYGLGASLLNMERNFLSLAEQRRIAGKPVYLRILLQEADGNILVDTASAPGPDPAVPLNPDAGDILVPADGPSQQVLVTYPLHYKEKLMGWLVAWVNQNLIRDHLVAARNEQPGGRIQLRRSGEVLADSPGLDDKPFGAWHTRRGGILGRVPVPDTPFEIIGSFPPQGLSALLSPRWISAALVVLSILILWGAWVAVRMRTDNLVLQARFEESSKQEKLLSLHNQELKKEIAQRHEYERELLQARQDAEAASRAKGEFLSTMSHEIRTPLNGVLGMAQVLTSTSLDDEQEEYIQVISESGNALLSIIDDILDFSKIEAGKMILAPVPFNLKECAETVLGLFAVQASAKGLTTCLDYAESIPGQLVGDPGRIRQILINLMGNAVKFTHQGRIDLQVRCLSHSDNAVSIRVNVRDTGIGIPRATQTGLFESFTQADSTTAREFGGAGLGLAISKKLVELMNGRIGVDSSPGEGSEFWFELTLAEAEQPKQTETPFQSPRMPSAGETTPNLSGRVLLAEDVLANRMVAASMLKRSGLQVEFAHDGQDAVNKWRQGSFDLILMDCQMPVMDGYSATRIIRNLEADRHLPIVALTADAFEDNRQRCIDAGMDDFITKPFEAGVLYQTVSRWLSTYDIPDRDPEDKPNSAPTG